MGHLLFLERESRYFLSNFKEKNWLCSKTVSFDQINTAFKCAFKNLVFIYIYIWLLHNWIKYKFQKEQKVNTISRNTSAKCRFDAALSSAQRATQFALGDS